MLSTQAEMWRCGAGVVRAPHRRRGPRWASICCVALAAARPATAQVTETQPVFEPGGDVLAEAAETPPPEDPLPSPSAGDAPSPTPLSAEEEVDPCEGGEGFLIGLHGAAFLPVGSWADHRLAGEPAAEGVHPSDLTQYGPGGGVILELGYRWCNRLGMILQTDVGSISTGEWDDYVSSIGGEIDSWAMQWAINVMLALEAVRAERFRFELRAGLGYHHLYGRERNDAAGVTYAYAPAGASASFRFGAGVIFPVGRSFDVVLLADFGLGLPGVEYVGEGDRPVMAFATSMGFRWLSGTD